MSVRGRRWVMRATPPHDLAGGDYPPLIATLLAQRGARTRADARVFLYGSGAPPNPFDLPGVARTVARVLAAIDAGDRIAVFGDYDVDGVTATAILQEAIADLGGDVVPHIPNRFTDGYGLTRPGLRAVRDRGVRLVLTADCGVTANPEVEYAAAIGLEVVVLDHHTPPPVLPAAAAIVDPKLGGGPAELDGLASCGVALTVVRALFAAAGRSLDETRFLDLAALGTVADMVPLTGENRRIVRAGLAVLGRSPRPGVRALLACAGLDGAAPTTEDIAFRLAPRLNAAGRLDDAGLALELLTTADEARAQALARRLNELNAERQRLTDDALALARELLATDGNGSPLIMVGHERIPQGIVGLVAGKLVEEMYRPAVVYERRADLCRGSVRSIRELDAVRCLAQGGDLMERWGGHAAAGGFSVRTERLERLKAVLSEWAAAQLAGVDLRPVFEADAEFRLAHLRGQELRWLKYFEPCGQDNPPPTLVSRGVPVMRSRAVGSEGRHLRLTLRDGIATWDAVGFNLGHAAPPPGTRIDVMYTVVPDRMGRSLQLQVCDFAPAEERLAANEHA
jgi:single-stranded-DNA-specific exonuclease